jgi:hypothetical protein
MNPDDIEFDFIETETGVALIHREKPKLVKGIATINGISGEVEFRRPDLGRIQRKERNE